MIFRLREFVVYPLAIRRFHTMLLEAERWPTERRRGWVQERLDATLRHAVRNVPYYKRTLGAYQPRFNEMVDRLDLSELPCITKETIRQHAAELRADDAHRYRPTPVRTSGSTGTPTEFLVDRHTSVAHFASLWRVLNWAGYHFGDRFADMTGEVLANDALFHFDARLNCLRLSSFNFKKENVPLYHERLRKFRPGLIKGYPSALALFCRWTRELGVEPYRPRAVLTCAESVLDHQRAVIEETFGCPMFDFYAQNERAALISTCEKGRYHVHEEYAHVELVPTSDDFRPPSPAAEIVTTTFHSFAMPLIRYRLGDLAEPDDDGPCACGRAYRRVRRITGRVVDVVVTPDGRHVGGLAAAFLDAPGIRVSQVVQETVDEIRVDVVRAQTYTPRDGESVLRELRTRLGGALRIRLNFVDSIAPGRNGKIQFIVSTPGREAVRAPVVADRSLPRADGAAVTTPQ